MMSGCTKRCERSVAKQQFPLKGSTIFAFGPPRQCTLPNFLKVMRGFLLNLHYVFLVLQFARCHPPVSLSASQSHATSVYLHYLHAISIERVSMQEGRGGERSGFDCCRPLSIVHLQIAMHRRRRMIRGPSACDVCKRLPLPGMHFITASL